MTDLHHKTVQYKGITLTWEQDGPVPVIKQAPVLQALDMSAEDFDAWIRGLENPYWGPDTFEYDALWDAMLKIGAPMELHDLLFPKNDSA